MPTAVNVTTDWCAPAGTPFGTGPTTIANGKLSPAFGVNELLEPRLRFPLVGISAEAPVNGARNAIGADTGPDEIDIGMSVGEENAVRVTVSWYPLGSFESTRTFGLRAPDDCPTASVPAESEVADVT